MDFELPSELVILKKTVRRFVDAELIPIEMQAMEGPDLKPEIRTRLKATARETGCAIRSRGGLGTATEMPIERM